MNNLYYLQLISKQLLILLIFMFEVLQKFNFHENFIKWIKILHYNVESCVLNNGYSTGYFKLERGTRQGDPIAAYLFIIVLEILACMVRQNNEIKGINVNSNEIKLCMYADYSTFFVKDLECLEVLKKTINTSTSMSSISINYDKSEAAWLGNKNTPNYITPKICKWVDLNEGFLKILGIYFSYDTKIVKQLNFDSVLQNLNSVLNFWKLRSLTIYGRTEIVKSLALPKIMCV